MRLEPLAYVDEQAISIRDMHDLLARSEDAMRGGDGFTLFTLNLDHLVKRRASPSFRELYARARFVTADGWPVVSLARRVGADITRTAGADLVVPLCRLAARLGAPVALFGTSPAVLVAAAEKLRALCPGLAIVFSESPDGFDPKGVAAEAASDRIAASGARLCFLALGAPKQEIFADLAAQRHPQIGFACIGAALDFIAGAHRRAPLVVQRARLEWAWRLAFQPGRLGTRYARCALLFARLLLDPRQAVRAPTPRAQT